MAKHITDKDFYSTIGSLDDIDFLNQDEVLNLVDVINKLAKRVAILEGNNPELYVYSKTSVLPVDGIEI